MEVKEMILLHREFLADFGYKLDPKSFHYSKSFSQGKKIVFFHHAHLDDLSYIEYHLGVRFDIVENIVHQFLPSLGDYKDRSITLVETLDGINSKMPRRTVVNNDHEISSIIDTSENFLVEEGFKWLETYSSGKNLERFFNEGLEKNLLTQNFTYRSARGVTLCKLYNPDQFDEVKTKYLNLLEEMQVTPFTLACFLNLLNYLKNL